MVSAKIRKLIKRLDRYCDLHMTVCENCPLNTLSGICDAEVWSQYQIDILNKFLKIRGF